MKLLVFVTASCIIVSALAAGEAAQKVIVQPAAKLATKQASTGAVVAKQPATVVAAPAKTPVVETRKVVAQQSHGEISSAQSSKTLISDGHKGHQGLGLESMMGPMAPLMSTFTGLFKGLGNLGSLGGKH